MINQKSYTKEWIESFRKQKEYRTVNPPLFEKMIYAFSLLELLAGSGFDFIFKGGTSLLLLPIVTNRFSSDIDIITENSKEKVYQFISKAITGSVFTSFFEDTDRANKGGIPKAHYVFSYNPVYNKDGHILLDVLFEKCPYSELSKVEIKSKWIDTSAPWFRVTIPSVNSILGDKLTAFAPKTTGVPYWLKNPGKPDKRLEIIKQLYDVSLLINQCNNVSETCTVFKSLAMNQITYRKLNIGTDDIINDIFETALVLAKRDRNITEPEKLYFKDLQEGLKMFDNHLINTKFRIEDAITASAKTAYFTQHIKHLQDTPFCFFQENADVFAKEIINPVYNFMNRFKKTNKEAFFYWYKCLDLMNLTH